MPKILPFSAVEPAAWPPAFRRLHVLRKKPSGPLDKPSVAATWRTTTFNLHVWSVGYFVGWLQWSQRFKVDAELQEYVTPEIMGAYVEDMRTPICRRAPWRRAWTACALRWLPCRLQLARNG